MTAKKELNGEKLCRDDLRAEIIGLLLQCNAESDLSDTGKSVFCSELGFVARDLAYVCLQLKQKYQCDLGKAVEQIEDYSINAITDAFHAVINAE